MNENGSKDMNDIAFIEADRDSKKIFGGSEFRDAYLDMIKSDPNPEFWVK